jgi:gas vesicle protein
VPEFPSQPDCSRFPGRPREINRSLKFAGSEKKEIFIMADENNGGGPGIAWFIAGIGIGALVGVLYAPKAGRETREDLAHGARGGKEYLRTKSKEAAQQVGAFVDKSKDQVSDLVDKGKDQVGDYVDRGREVVDKGRAQWADFVERGKGLVGDQASRVGAAVDAGREAYKSATSEPGSAQ